MSNRRAPLANVPNAANSPFRGLGPVGKRARPQSNSLHDVPHGQPPSKRQMLEKEDVESQTLSRGQLAERVFTKVNAAPPTAFEQKLRQAAAVTARERDRQSHSRSTRLERHEKGNSESMRQWREHYRAAFPRFVFYFESIPEEVRVRCAKQIVKLGAREEKFFSKNVTHVVTTRLIPPEYDDSTSTESTAPSSTTTENPNLEIPPQTINPSLLERSSEKMSSQAMTSRFPVEGNLSRRSNLSEVEIRKDTSSKMDVLVKARQMKMKIWALEKLTRMINTITEGDGQHAHNTRSHSTTSVGYGRPTRESDLSQLLRNERIHGPSDRDPTVSTKDLTLFKGYFLYIHDVDEKHRPVMVRDYPTVLLRQDGEWPQFRSVSQGKCPFVEEVISKRELEKERERERQEQRALRLAQREAQGVPKTRSTTASEVKMEPPLRRSVLKEVPTEQRNRKVEPEKQMPASKCLIEPQNTVLAKHESSAKGSENFPPPVFRNVAPLTYGGEPAASGVQPSNITSAIRSQMISSTAAAPGAKAGTSKEVHELKRKVLERSTSNHSIPSIPQSHRMTDIAGALKKATSHAPREAKRKAQEKLGLGLIDEEVAGDSDDENSQTRAALVKRGQAAPRKPAPEKREPKPGYCENCRDKFADFDDHILSRKHRKFATTDRNWTELDDLLAMLVRPGKEEGFQTSDA